MSQNNKISVLAPAKLNLRLKIVGRRADGYHLLSMLNAGISLYDTLEFEIFKSDPKLNLQIELVVDPNLESLGTANNLLSSNSIYDNLVYRAAKLFLAHFAINDHALKIKLTKNIPVGAGLGGGSSDASSTLLTLSKYFFPELNIIERIQQLSDLALKLGSDLPFFIHAGLETALYHVSGIGEVVQKLAVNPLSKKDVLLISPSAQLSTQAVYKAFASNNQVINTSDSLGIKRPLTYQQILEYIDNDLSLEVFRLSKECEQLMKYLKSLPNIVSSVTGSGSSIFCISKDEADSQALKGLRSDLKRINTSFLLKSQIVQFL